MLERLILSVVMVVGISYRVFRLVFCISVFVDVWDGWWCGFWVLVKVGGMEWGGI